MKIIKRRMKLTREELNTLVSIKERYPWKVDTNLLSKDCPRPCRNSSSGTSSADLRAR